MKKNIYSSIFYLVLIFLSMNIFAESTDIIMPSGTVLNKKEAKTGVSSTNYTYCYSSTLSKDEIIQFYKKLFISHGMYEIPSLNGNMFMFQKIPLKTASLSFVSTSSKEKTDYFITMIEITKLPILPSNDFKSPQTLDFMPAYSNATQFLYYNSPTSPFIGVGYLTHSSPEEVKSFYLEQMSGFSWILTREDPHSGTYSFPEWLKFVDPYTQMLSYHNFAAGFSEILPPLKLRGATFTFEQGKKKCTIAIYKFEDALEKAKVTKTVWDVSPFERYGDTIIEVYYFYK